MKVQRYPLSVISFLAAFFMCGAELSVNLTPETARRFIYEPFTLLLETGSAKTERPEIPAHGPLRVINVSPAENGYRIEVLAEEPGTLTFPPVTVRTENETAQTAPLRLTVSAPRKADEMTLSAVLSSTSLFVDQPAQLDVIWESSVPFKHCQELLLEIPLLHNPLWEIYPVDPGVPEEQRIGLPVNGQRVIAQRETNGERETIRFSYRLKPGEPALIHPKEIRLSCALMQDSPAASRYPSYFDNHFFNRPSARDRFERIYLSAALPSVTVQALPEKGRTARYSGIVGTASARASVRPAETVVGQPMLLSVTVDHLTFGNQIRALPAATLDGLGPQFSIVPDPLHEESGSTSKTFTYVVRPLRSGLPRLPALAFQIFDPEQKTYRTVRTAPLPVTVEPDNGQTLYHPHAAADPDVKRPRFGIRHNRTESRLTMTTYPVFEWMAAHATALWLLPPMIWLALRLWLRRRDRDRVDPAYARARRARRRFFRTAKQDQTAAWTNYLADRFNLNAETVTFESVAAELKKRQADDSLIENVRRFFLRQETKTYAPPQTTPQDAPTAKQLVRQIEKSIRILLLALCLLSFSESRAAPPWQRFEQAMLIQAEKPDEAGPLFIEAALGFEAEQQFFNAGNAWFFAGSSGRALANYRAAEIRRPFNRLIRESIAFIRAQRPDRFQTPDKPVAKISSGWNAFCRWDPVLRGSLLTLCWVLGWISFLTARVLGKRIPRHAWILLGIAAAIPALSLIHSLFQPKEGVLIQTADARLGPGYAYNKAYETPLHEAVEFHWIEERNGWVHARLPDGNEVWLRKSACAPISTRQFREISPKRSFPRTRKIVPPSLSPAAQSAQGGQNENR
jgi:hypothetical protein